VVLILVVVLLCIVIGIALFELIQIDAGYVLISVGDTTVESSFWFALFALFLSVCCVFLSYYIVSRVLRSISRGGQWLSVRHHAGIERRYREGLLHFLIGNYDDATKLLQSVARRPELPVVRAIATAQAKARLGQSEAAILILNAAADQYPEDTSWITFAKVQLLIQQQHFDEARVLIEYLKELNPGDRTISALEYQLHVGSGKWTDALEISAARNKPQLLDTETMEEVYLNNLDVLAASKDITVKAVDDVWQQIPKECRSKAEFQTCYAQALSNTGDDKSVLQFVLKTLKKVWIPALADIYLKLESVKPEEQVKQLEQWLAMHGENAEICLFLGIAAVKTQLWGKAKSYLDKSLDLHETSKVLYMLGYLAEQKGEEKQSLEYYRRSAGIHQ
jgi:HemY protein